MFRPAPLHSAMCWEFFAQRLCRAKRVALPFVVWGMPHLGKSREPKQGCCVCRRHSARHLSRPLMLQDAASQLTGNHATCLTRVALTGSFSQHDQRTSLLTPLLSQLQGREVCCSTCANQELRVCGSKIDKQCWAGQLWLLGAEATCQADTYTC